MALSLIEKMRLTKRNIAITNELKDKLPLRQKMALTKERIDNMKLLGFGNKSVSESKKVDNGKSLAEQYADGDFSGLTPQELIAKIKEVDQAGGEVSQVKAGTIIWLEKNEQLLIA